MLYGVDVHARYQGGLDVALLARQGYSFLATKATEGLGVVSVEGFTAEQFTARMLTWIAQTRQAGMIPGLYHYLRSQDGAAQCDAFMRIVERAGGPEGLLIQLDCEADGYGPQMTAWARRWAQLTDHHPFLIYSGSWWWPQTGGFNGAGLTPYLWHSHYLTADTDTIPDDPAAFAARIPASWWIPGYGGWPSATILQFTSRGDAGSLGNNVDLNATPLTREQLLTLTRKADDMTPQELLAAKLSTGITVNNALVTLLARAPWDLVGRLDAILAAAQDDGDVTVVVSPEVLAEFQAVRSAVAALPAGVANELAQRVAE